MQFPTVTFVVFFGVVLTGAWLLAQWPVLRKLWLISAGGVFYAYWDERFVALIAGVIVFSWTMGHLIARTSGERRRTWLLAGGIAAELSVLAFFKYYGFFVDSVSSGLSRVGLHTNLPLLQIAVPIGVSFYVFQAISYLIEVRRRRVEPAALIDVATWLAFFPTLTSGPITRASEFLPQLVAAPDDARSTRVHAYWLISRGLVKKLVLASFLASAITDNTFANPSSYSSLTLLLGVYAYAVQIYCDFSGYTDMALGIAALLGFKLPDNFNRPYAATSVQDFWSRWHMTLSRWLRDYLFAPLTGLDAKRPVRTYASVVAVMLLAGLWHGAAWGFVVFGGVHGVAMATERWRRVRRRRLRRPLPARTPLRQAVRRVVTFHIVCLGWVFFATPSLSAAGSLLRNIATNWALPVTDLTPLLLLAIAAVLAAQFLPDRLGERALEWATRLNPVAQGVAFAGASVPILAMAPTTIPAFIYYRF